MFYILSDNRKDGALNFDHPLTMLYLYEYFDDTSNSKYNYLKFYFFLLLTKYYTYLSS